LRENTLKIYAVGGSVRDELLGLDVKDRDYVVVGATPQQMIDAGYKAVGADFPVFLHPQTQEQYALARTERKTGPGYSGFAFHTSADVTLVDDLQRRDLTINAMAKDDDGTLIDPYGGAKDLADKLLRHVSEAFAEDPVRIPRVARFAARFAPLGFHVADETMMLMHAMVESGEVDHLVAERVWQELARGLMEATPSAMFTVLRECGALARILPEVERDKNSSMLPLDFAAKENLNLATRFAVLAHHLGDANVRTLCERIRVPAECRDLAITVARWHAEAHHARELDAEKLLSLFDGTDALRRPERFYEFLDACRCVHGAATRENSFLITALIQLQSMNQGAIAATVVPEDIAQAIRAAKLAVLDQHIHDYSTSERTS
jgi:tRNA nucleotidyltransferase (CCA-adding enzyme)